MIKQVISFLRTYKGNIFVSILWGLGLAALIFGICSGRKCIIIKPYHDVDITDKINNFKYNNRCYTYNKYAHPCP